MVLSPVSKSNSFSFEKNLEVYHIFLYNNNNNHDETTAYPEIATSCNAESPFRILYVDFV
jgi:hypothetical protein